MSAVDELGLTQPEQVVVEQPVVEAPKTDEFLGQFVGEGKKYGDVESLAKAYYNVEKHADIVKQENEEYRKELEQLKTKEKTIEEIMEAVGQQPDPVVEQAQPVIPDVNALVDKALAEKEQARRLDEVRSKSKQSLVEAFGEEGAFKTVELYVKGDPAKDNIVKTLAQTDPVGLVNLLKTVEQPASTVVNTTGVNTAPIRADSSGLEITWSQATEIRKSDPDAYKKIQNKINRSAAAAEKQGINYFAT